MWKIRFSSTAIIFCISLHYAYQYEIANKISGPGNNYDILKLAQQWPVTVCKSWISDLNGTGSLIKRTGCHFPTKKNRWTVHGIWPAKLDAEYNYCNASWAFDPEHIQSIEGDLEQAWTSVYKENDRHDFWRYEWMKHGTCATDLESFNSQFKYFSNGIEWNQKYSLSDMLAAANLFPDDTKEVDPEEFVNAVKAKTGKSAQVECYIVNGMTLLQELRLCFDKQLNMIDCQLPAVSKYCGSSVVFPANA